MMRLLLLAAASAVLMACTSAPAPESSAAVQQPQADWPAPVASPVLDVGRGEPAPPALEVGVVVFDPGIPEDASTHSRQGIFPEIRRAEARYMTVLLREALVRSNHWGAVRVLPHETGSVELLVTGRIAHSDGQQLVLAIRAEDATGRVWLDRSYRDVAQEADYPASAGSDPYRHLYIQVANDLLAMRSGLDPLALQAVPRVSELRYAASLSPEAFAGYLASDDSGRFYARRLPAEDDPMLARVQRIQNQEYLFIDTVDEQYLELYNRMGPTYDLWRQYGREQAIYKAEYEQRATSRESHGRRGTFAQMEQTYNAFRSTKIQQQDLHELALGFNNEVAPTVLEAGDRIFRLSGTLDTQYDEWRDILRKIFALETGLQSAP